MPNNGQIYWLRRYERAAEQLVAAGADSRCISTAIRRRACVTMAW